MAELDKLELKIAVDDQELQESTKSLNKSYSELDSTILKLNNNISAFSKYLELVNNNTLTLNSSLFELKDTFNNLNDGSVKFGQSLEVLMKNGSTFGHSINQSIEQTGDNVEDLKEDVEKTKSTIDRIFDSVLVRLAVTFYGIYAIIKGAISNFKTLISILKFLNDPVGTLSKAYKDLKDQIVPLIEKSKKIIDLVRTHRKEIAAALGISGLWAAVVAELGLVVASFVGMTAGQFLVLAGVTTVFVLAVTGQFELMGKALDSVYNNYLVPFFENLSKDTEDYTKIIDEANKAFESAFPMPTEPPARTPDPGLRLELQPVDPTIWEQLEREREERKLNNDELERGNHLIDEQSNLLNLNTGALASANGEMSAYSIGQGYMSDAVRGSTVDSIALRKQGIEPLAGRAKEANKAVLDLTSSFEAGAVVFGYTKEDLAGVSSAAADTGASVEQLGDTLEQVESSGGFFDGIKQGFIDFVENVESNSELMADFFANTLTEMSQNFSDLFYNVLTGKFDSLQDLAKQAFEAILRAFLDMVAAIATRQIVISIAGALGIGTKGASATDYLGFGKQAAEVGNDLAGMFSSGAGGAALGGSAALGGGISAIGAGAGAAGGATSVGASLGLSGISSLGTVPTGGAEECEYRLAA